MSAKASKAAISAKLSRAQLKKIWDAMASSDWLNLPNIGSLAARVYKQNDIVCLCPHPEHADSVPSFHIYVRQHHGHCFGCGYNPTDPIELVANITQTSYVDALNYVSTEISGATVLKTGINLAILSQQQLIQEAKNLFMYVCHEQLVSATKAYTDGITYKNNPSNFHTLEDEDLADCDYSQLKPETDYPGEDTSEETAIVPVSRLPNNVIPITGAGTDSVGIKDFDYAMATIKWLVEVRKIPVELLPQLPIGIVPPMAAILSLAQQYPIQHSMARVGGVAYEIVELLQALKNFLSAEHNKGAIAMGTGSVIFPLCATDSHITSFRVRQPTDPGDAKRINLFQDDFEPGAGFFGVNFQPYKQYHRTCAAGHVKAYIVVEGEFDALQPMVRVLQTGKVTCPVISAGGSSALSLFDDFLEANSINNILLVGDSPIKDETDSGSNIIAQWIHHISKANITVFSNESWEKLAPSNDIDHAYAESGILPETIDAELYNVKNYIPAWRWAFDRAESALSAYHEDNVSALIASAASSGHGLHNREDIDAYVRCVHEAFPIVRPGPLKRALSSQGDGETGFITRIADTILEDFDIIGIRNNDRGGKELLLYHRNDSRFTTLRLDSEQSIVQEIAQLAGTLHTFIVDKVGFPDFLNRADDANQGSILQAQDRKLRYYVKEAVLTMAAGAPDMDGLMKLRNGYHYLLNREMLIHGPKSYEFNRDPGTLTFKEGKAARVDDYLIDVYGDDPYQRECWYTPEPVTPSLLLESQSYDMLSIYNDLVNFFDIGFSFDNQLPTCQLLAALILTFPIMASFDRQIVMHFTGDTGSGKSTLMSVFSPSDKDSSNMSIQLLYASRYFLKITAAAFTRLASHSTVLHCIDELEFDSSTQRKHSEGVMESLRGITSGGGSRTISRMDGEGTTTHKYNVPVIFASITGTEKPQDLNRLITINMQKVEGREDPNSVIYRTHKPEQFKRLRRAVNFGMYKHIPAIRKTYDELRHSYSEINATLPTKVEFRYMSAFFPIFAVMEAIGVDYKQFFHSYVASNEILIKRNTGISESESFMTKILHNKAIRLGDSKDDIGLHTLATILVNDIQRSQLNSAGVGVFYDERNHLMLFNLEQVVNTLIPSQVRFASGITAMGLRNLLERHKAALTPAEILNSGILNRAAVDMGVGLRLNDIVVFHSRYWLDEYYKIAETKQRSNDPPKAPQTPEVKQNPTPLVEDKPEDKKEEPEIAIATDDWL